MLDGMGNLRPMFSCNAPPVGDPVGQFNCRLNEALEPVGDIRGFFPQQRRTGFVSDNPAFAIEWPIEPALISEKIWVTVE